MLKVTWDQIRRFYYQKRDSQSPEWYYKGKFEEIELFFQDKDFTENNILDFLSTLETRFTSQNKVISPSYYGKYVSLLRRIAKMLKTPEVMDEIEGKRKKFKPTELLTKKEWEKLLEVVIPYQRNSDYLNFKWRLIIEVHIITTKRPKYLRSLKWDHFVNNCFLFDDDKNNTPHKSYLPQEVADDVRKLNKYDHGYVFGSVRGPFDLKEFNKEIKKRLNAAGIQKNITARSMRGTGITAYLKKYSIQKVAKISNHKNINVLMEHYYNPDEEELIEIARHNEVRPDPYNMQDLLNDLRDLDDKYRGSIVAEIMQSILLYVMGKATNTNSS